jgi:hypothetical protein
MTIVYGAGNSVDRNGSPIGDGVESTRRIINAVSTVYLPVGMDD